MATKLEPIVTYVSPSEKRAIEKQASGDTLSNYLRSKLSLEPLKRGRTTTPKKKQKKSSLQSDKKERSDAVNNSGADSVPAGPSNGGESDVVASMESRAKPTIDVYACGKCFECSPNGWPKGLSLEGLLCGKEGKGSLCKTANTKSGHHGACPTGYQCAR